MSYPSFRTYLRTLQELVKRKSPGLAEESIILSNLCLHYGKQMGLPEREMKTLFLAAHFKNLGAITISNQAFSQSFDNYDQLMAYGASWFEESAKLAQMAGLPDVELILTEYYHRAIPDAPLAKVFQVLNAWVACHQKRGWRRAMSDREALIVLKQRAMLDWSDPDIVSRFVRFLPLSPRTVHDYLQVPTLPSHQSFNDSPLANRPQPVESLML
jgi:hypothetical protein